jgi:hypothetical protein
MNILALDLGKFNTTCCFFDTKTRKARFFNTPTQREHLATVIKKNKADLVVMEACGPSGWPGHRRNESDLTALLNQLSHWKPTNNIINGGSREPKHH